MRSVYTFLSLALVAFACLPVVRAQDAITVSKFEYSVTVRQLDAAGSVAKKTYKRTEYFTGDGLARVEDTDSAGNQYPVLIRNPRTNVQLSIDDVKKTITETHTQIGSVLEPREFLPSPAPSKNLGGKVIAGLNCHGFSSISSGGYYEVWNCGKRDFGTFINRAKNGTGVENRLQRYTPSVQVPADFFTAPSGFITQQGPK